MSDTDHEKTLYYVIDPMCSWCWGFRPTWEVIAAKLLGRVRICYQMGGLAPDNKEPMPAEMQAKLQGIWHQIQRAVPGTKFNFDFWDQCRPRRSTYAACRAVIAARNQGVGAEAKMILAIQQAYYLQARNPSDLTTLIELGEELDFDMVRYESDMKSDTTQLTLLGEIQQNKEFGVQGFPSLVVKDFESTSLVALEFGNVDAIVNQVLSCN